MKLLYTAYDTIGNKYNSQCLGSLLSLFVSSKTSIIRERIVIVTNMTAEWHAWIKEFDLLRALDLEIVPYRYISPLTAKELKLKAVRHFVADGEPLFFIDTDTVFWLQTPILTDLYLRQLADKGYDFIGALECAPTRTDGGMNINTGLLGFTGSDRSRFLAADWHQLYLQKVSRLSDKGMQQSLADQPVFQNLVMNDVSKGWILHNVYNLRFHPNFDGCEWLWSPVCMIHNHELSLHLAEVLLASGPHNWYFHLKRIKNKLNPPDNAWSPRMIRLKNILE